MEAPDEHGAVEEPDVLTVDLELDPEDADAVRGGAATAKGGLIADPEAPGGPATR